MDSDSSDMFPPTQFSGGSKVSRRSRSQRAEPEYDRVILFNWDHWPNRLPFQSFPKTHFLPGEISLEWLKYQMVPKSRMRKLEPFKSLPGQSLSMFAKVEQGIILYIKLIFKYDMILWYDIILSKYFFPPFHFYTIQVWAKTAKIWSWGIWTSNLMLSLRPTNPFPKRILTLSIRNLIVFRFNSTLTRMAYSSKLSLK